MSTASQLVEAAKLILLADIDDITATIDKHPEGEGHTEEWESVDCGSEVYSAAVEMARHVLATVKPDDDEPVTADWLRPLCIEVSEYGSYWVLADLADHNRVTCIKWSCGFHLKVGGVSVADRATRGDVRRLCAALKIDLKENADADTK